MQFNQNIGIRFGKSVNGKSFFEQQKKISDEATALKN